jgi:hypothetical protein
LDLAKGKGIVMISLNFLVRRFLIGVSVVFNDQITVQIFTLLLGVLVEIAVNSTVNPYDTPFLNNNVYFNEIIIVTTMYSFICFTDFVPDMETRSIIGYTACSTVCLHLGLNIFFMLSASLH